MTQSLSLAHWGAQVVNSSNGPPTSVHAAHVPAAQPSELVHSQPGKPGPHTCVLICGKTSSRQLKPGGHSSTTPPSLGSARFWQLGVHTSGAPVAACGSTFWMQVEPGSQAMPLAL